MPLNCTYWNWNKFMKLRPIVYDPPLNCTYWNWNDLDLYLLRICQLSLNCTYWNWNCIDGKCENRRLSSELYLLELKRWIVRRFDRRLLALNCTYWNWNNNGPRWKKVVTTLNCTYWNWNTESVTITNNWSLLWIVPIGIETREAVLWVPWAAISELYLLELKRINCWNRGTCRKWLWIVPIGIETRQTLESS